MTGISTKRPQQILTKHPLLSQDNFQFWSRSGHCAMTYPLVEPTWLRVLWDFCMSTLHWSYIFMDMLLQP